MKRLVIETLDSPVSVKKGMTYPRAGGHASVRALQASILWPRRSAKRNPEVNPHQDKAEKLSNGVLLHRFCDQLQQWFPYQRITLQDFAW